MGFVALVVICMILINNVCVLKPVCNQFTCSQISQHHFMLISCLCVLSGVNMGRGDVQPLANLMVKPYILTMSSPDNFKLPSLRRKRSTEAENTCDA